MIRYAISPVADTRYQPILRAYACWLLLSRRSSRQASGRSSLAGLRGRTAGGYAPRMSKYPIIPADLIWNSSFDPGSYRRADQLIRLAPLALTEEMDTVQRKGRFRQLAPRLARPRRA